MDPSVTKDLSISLESAPISIYSLLIFFVFNLFLWITAFLWTKCYFRHRTLAGSIIVFLLLYFAQVVLLFTLLGLLGALRLGYIFLGLLLMFILTLGFLWMRLPLLKSVLSTRRGKWAPGRQEKSLWMNDYYLMILFALVLVLFFQGLIIAIVMPPNAWGAINYHLTFPMAWMKSASIEVFSFPLGDHADSYSPSNIELFYLLLLGPLRSDLLAKVGQLPFWVLGALALYSLGRELGISPKAARFPALFFVLTPQVFRQAFTAEVDVAFAALLLTMYYFWLVYERKPEHRWLVLAAISYGLFISTKYVAVVYTPWVLLPILISILRGRGRANYFKSVIVNICIFFGVTLIFGGFWYIRNFVITGSPIYPVSVKVFGVTIFPGAFSREAMLTSEFHLTQAKDLLRILVEGCGAPFLFLAIVGLVWALIRTFLSDRHMLGPRIYLFTTPLMLGAVYWWGIPYNSELRFLFGAIGLAYLSLGYLLNGPERYVPWLKRLVLIVFLFNTFKILPVPWFDSLTPRPPGLVASGFQETVCIIASCFVGFLCLYILRKQLFARTRFLALRAVLCTLVAASIIMAILFPYFVYPPKGQSVPRQAILRNVLFQNAFGETKSKLPLDLGYVNYNFYFLAWDWVSKHIHGQTVAFTGYNLPYFLYGRDLTNKVCYVNVNGHLNWKFHNYDLAERQKAGYLPPKTNKPVYHRKDKDVEAWLSNLKARGVNYLFVTRLKGAVAKRNLLIDRENFPIERRWADERPTLFTLVHPVGEIPNPLVRIYKVNFIPKTVKTGGES